MKKVLMALSAFAVVLLASPAFAHGKLQASTPKEGSTLEQAPKLVRLQFNEPVEATLTTVKLVDTAGQEVKTAKAEVPADDAKAVVLALPALTTGSYRALWSMVGPDGHRVKGELKFSVK
jgi:methionine-rich copper-binding protein CopC